VDGAVGDVEGEVRMTGGEYRGWRGGKGRFVGLLMRAKSMYDVGYEIAAGDSFDGKRGGGVFVFAMKLSV